jgi:type II secretory pathway component GspD/PulD (secretin)
MMGPFGEVVAITRSNQLLLQDTAGNIRRIKRMVEDIEQSERGQNESYAYTCKYIKAREAERILKNQLGDPEESGE